MWQRKLAVYFAALLLLSALCAWHGSQAAAEEMLQISRSELEAVAKESARMMQDVQMLQQYVQELNGLLQTQRLLTAQYRTSWEKSGREASRWRRASQVEGALLLGFAGGAIAWYCLR